MMRVWLQILPVFVYKWLARKYSGQVVVSGIAFAEPAKDILVRVKP